MSQQKTIKTYFQQFPANRTFKRSISDVENKDNANIMESEKKLKTSEEEAECNSSNTFTDASLCDSKNKPKVNESVKLDKETLQKIEFNKLSAQLKLLSKECPAIHTNIGLTWFKTLKEEFTKPYFKKLSKFLVEERAKSTPVFPRPEEVWTWTRECPVDEIKVVILGQDPYHHPGQAHGLCFSVPIGVPPPPSLLNIYKELEDDIDGFKRPGHGYLIGWARQGVLLLNALSKHTNMLIGVLLLNAVLTVRCRTPNSHKDQGWEKLTDAVIKHLNTHGDGIVFLLWGAYAQKKAEFVDQKKHHLLKSVHPSPLSASRGFLGCKHFSKCNQLLVSHGKKPIDWASLPTE